MRPEVELDPPDPVVEPDGTGGSEAQADREAPPAGGGVDHGWDRDAEADGDGGGGPGAEPGAGPVGGRADRAAWGLPGGGGVEGGPGFAVPLDPDAPDQDPVVRLRRDVEAILLVADQPVSAAALAGVLEHPAAHVEDVLVDLAAEYAGDQRGFVLRAVAGGWRLYTHPASHPAVDAYLRAGTQQRLTQAALETLAVVAYRQPVTRAHVAAVRGVNVDGVLRTLLNRGLIAEVGRDEGPGQAVLYGTTPLFMEQLGINSLDELPPVADYLPEGVDLSGLEEAW